MAEIEIYDVITDDTARMVKSELGKLNKSDPVLVSINSVGGELHNGIAAYHHLRRHAGEVTTRVDGAAFSAASVLMLAGDKREFADNALALIHNPWMGFVPGEIPELRRALEFLNRNRKASMQIYANRTEWTIEQAGQAMSEEKILDSQEALTLGFATEVTDAQPVNMLVDLERLPPQSRERIAELLETRVVPLSQAEARAKLRKARERATTFLEV